MFRLVTLLMLALLSPQAAQAQAACPKGNLATKNRLVNGSDVRFTHRLSDGIMPAEGSAWNGVYSSILPSERSVLVYDLGTITRINGLLVQGDNNDTYEVSVSDDNTTYRKVWTVPAHPKPGMRLRLQQGLGTDARYIKLSNAKGDGSYSLGEFGIYCTLPSIWPPPLEIKGTTPKKSGKDARRFRMAYKKMTVATLGFICILLMLALRRRNASREEEGEADEQGDTQATWLEWAIAGTAFALVGFMFWAVAHEFKRISANPMILTSVFAGLAALWGGWLLWQINKKAGTWRTWLERGALVIIVFSGGMSWVNFGTFHGSKAIHYWDTFHYYIGGKYFPENEYTLLYHCSAIAELDDGRKSEFKSRQIRNLSTNSLGPAEPVLEDVQVCRDRFTPERWNAFRQDLRLFRSFMGKDWWEKMFKDHGFNATPVWTLLGHHLTNTGWAEIPPPAGLENSPANLKGASAEKRRQVRERFKVDRAAFEKRVGWLNVIDGLLYAASFALIWWAFGLWGCAFAILIWGVGYPWAYFWTGGGFGRVPWFFMAVAGTCFLKKGKFALGGAAITWSMLLRVFPGALIAGVSLKIAHGIVTARTISKNHLRLILGCTVALGVLVALSLPTVGGTKAYSDFIGNSLKHKATGLTNHMGLPTLLGYAPSIVGRKTRDNKLDDPFLKWKVERKKLQDKRKWVQSVCVVLFLGLIWYAGRRLDDWEVTALSTILITGIFELTCYYYSYLVLLALLSMRRQIYMIAMFGLVVGGHLIHLNIGWYDEQYTAESALALGIQLFILVGLAVETFLAEGEDKDVPPEQDSSESVPSELELEPTQE